MACANSQLDYEEIEETAHNVLLDCLAKIDEQIDDDRPTSEGRRSPAVAAAAFDAPVMCMPSKQESPDAPSLIPISAKKLHLDWTNRRLTAAKVKPQFHFVETAPRRDVKLKRGDAKSTDLWQNHGCVVCRAKMDTSAEWEKHAASAPHERRVRVSEFLKNTDAYEWREGCQPNALALRDGSEHCLGKEFMVEFQDGYGAYLFWACSVCCVAGISHKGIVEHMKSGMLSAKVIGETLMEKKLRQQRQREANRERQKKKRQEAAEKKKQKKASDAERRRLAREKKDGDSLSTGDSEGVVIDPTSSGSKETSTNREEDDESSEDEVPQSPPTKKIKLKLLPKKKKNTEEKKGATSSADDVVQMEKDDDDDMTDLDEDIPLSQVLQKRAKQVEAKKHRKGEHFRGKKTVSSNAAHRLLPEGSVASSADILSAEYMNTMIERAGNTVMGQSYAAKSPSNPRAGGEIDNLVDEIAAEHDAVEDDAAERATNEEVMTAEEVESGVASAVQKEKAIEDLVAEIGDMNSTNADEGTERQTTAQKKKKGDPGVVKKKTREEKLPPKTSKPVPKKKVIVKEVNISSSSSSDSSSSESEKEEDEEDLEDGESSDDDESEVKKQKKYRKMAGGRPKGAYSGIVRPLKQKESARKEDKEAESGEESAEEVVDSDAEYAGFSLSQQSAMKRVKEKLPFLFDGSFNPNALGDAKKKIEVAWPRTFTQEESARVGEISTLPPVYAFGVCILDLQVLCCNRLFSAYMQGWGALPPGILQGLQTAGQKKRPSTIPIKANIDLGNSIVKKWKKGEYKINTLELRNEKAGPASRTMAFNLGDAFRIDKFDLSEKALNVKEQKQCGCWYRVLKWYFVVIAVQQNSPVRSGMWLTLTSYLPESFNYGSYNRDYGWIEFLTASPELFVNTLLKFAKMHAVQWSPPGAAKGERPQSKALKFVAELFVKEGDKSVYGKNPIPNEKLKWFMCYVFAHFEGGFFKYLQMRKLSKKNREMSVLANWDSCSIGDFVGKGAHDSTSELYERRVEKFNANIKSQFKELCKERDCFLANDGSVEVNPLPFPDRTVCRSSITFLNLLMDMKEKPDKHLIHRIGQLFADYKCLDMDVKEFQQVKAEELTCLSSDRAMLGEQSFWQSLLDKFEDKVTTVKGKSELFKKFILDKGTIAAMNAMYP